jgi:hypothetical protein
VDQFKKLIQPKLSKKTITIQRGVGSIPDAGGERIQALLFARLDDSGSKGNAPGCGC